MATPSLGIFQTQLDQVGGWIRDLQRSLLTQIILYKPAQVEMFPGSGLYMLTCLKKLSFGLVFFPIRKKLSFLFS